MHIGAYTVTWSAIITQRPIDELYWYEPIWLTQRGTNFRVFYLLGHKLTIPLPWLKIGVYR